MVRDYMDALGKRRIPEIARGTGQTVEEVQVALERIARLDPRPGRAFLPDSRAIRCRPKYLSRRPATILPSRPITNKFRTCASAISIRT